MLKIKDRKRFAAALDVEPSPFSHDLHLRDEFSRDSLLALSNTYCQYPTDYFVAGSATDAGDTFFSVKSGHLSPYEAFSQLERCQVRILLKRPENHDPRFRKIIEQMANEILSVRGFAKGERLVRLESAIFITSAASITPFHFDPEIAFFCQVRGEKRYHMYPPSSVSTPDLEKFYLQGLVSIGQLRLSSFLEEQEHVFLLKEGDGVHQPQNSPHWVKTVGDISVSYSLVFETNLSRSRGHTHSFNYYQRKLGLQPSAVGQHPLLDSIKANSIKHLIPLRRQLGNVIRNRH